MPSNTVYVGRPTKWGNPYMLSSAPHRANRTEMICYSREDAVQNYKTWMHACNARSTIDIPRIRAELRGKDLACWCPLNQPCHADVLLEIANAEPEEREESVSA